MRRLRPVQNLLVLVVDDGKDGEAVSGAELAAPARGDGVVAKALRRAGVSRGGGVAVAGVDEADVLLVEALGVDGEGGGARVVAGVAVADDVLEDDAGDRGHHVDGAVGDGGGDGRGGGQEGGDDGLSKVHFERVALGAG